MLAGASHRGISQLLRGDESDGESMANRVGYHDLLTRHSHSQLLLMLQLLLLYHL